MCEWISGIKRVCDVRVSESVRLNICGCFACTRPDLWFVSYPHHSTLDDRRRERVINMLQAWLDSKSSITLKITESCRGHCLCGCVYICVIVYVCACGGRCSGTLWTEAPLLRHCQWNTSRWTVKVIHSCLDDSGEGDRPLYSMFKASNMFITLSLVL